MINIVADCSDKKLGLVVKIVGKADLNSGTVIVNRKQLEACCST